MQNDLFEKPHRRHVRDLNIVPILDMLVTVIFFLLLSASFLEFNKVTVPPSKTSAITDPVAPPPLQPRLSLTREQNEYHIFLRWAGAKPGTRFEKVVFQEDGLSSQALSDAISRIVAEFKVNYPAETTLQLGLGRILSYQDLITAMDAVRKSITDVVLFSYFEAESEAQQFPPGAT